MEVSISSFSSFLSIEALINVVGKYGSKEGWVELFTFDITLNDSIGESPLFWLLTNRKKKWNYVFTRKKWDFIHLNELSNLLMPS